MGMGAYRWMLGQCKLSCFFKGILSIRTVGFCLDVSKVRNKGRVVPSALLEEHYAPCFKPYEKATAGSV